MTKYERIAFWLFMALVAGLILYLILPPVGWAVVALLVFSYFACEVGERAIRRVWRR